MCTLSTSKLPMASSHLLYTVHVHGCMKVYEVTSYNIIHLYMNIPVWYSQCRCGVFLGNLDLVYGCLIGSASFSVTPKFQKYQDFPIYWNFWVYWDCWCNKYTAVLRHRCATGVEYIMNWVLQCSTVAPTMVRASC